MFPTRFSLYKKGSTYHILFYLHGVRRWKSTGAKTKPEALKALTEFRKLLQHTSKPVFLTEFVPNFLTHAESIYSSKTLEIYKRVLPSFLGQVGDKLLVEVTAEHFDMYKAERLKYVKPVSVNIELRALRAAFNRARRWKLIETHPCQRERMSVARSKHRTFVFHYFQSR